MYFQNCQESITYHILKWLKRSRKGDALPTFATNKRKKIHTIGLINNCLFEIINV